jgi:hypothetical protein
MGIRGFAAKDFVYNVYILREHQRAQNVRITNIISRGNDLLRVTSRAFSFN